MTRKEEIRNASVAYNERAGKLLVMGGDSILSEEEYLEFNKNPSFIAGAEWVDKTMIDRVCDWIEDNIYDYLYINRDFNEADYKPELIEDLRKAMEDKL